MNSSGVDYAAGYLAGLDAARKEFSERIKELEAELEDMANKQDQLEHELRLRGYE